MGSLDESSSMVAQGWAALDKSGILQPYQFKLREVGPEDILIKVLYCGVCHTDLHQTRDDHGMSKYPMVPGHEVTGLVSKVGEKIKNFFSEGDRVGVGCIVGACGDCNACCDGTEHYCNKKIWTYNDVYYDGNPTQGGFANYMVVNHKFVVRIPESLRLDEAAPLLCAGSTVYSPLKFNNFTSIEECKGKTCGILGLGGVGHIGVKIAKAFGLHVTVISSSPKKQQEAIEVLGADSFLISSDEKQMKEAEQTLDFILDTVPSAHPLEPYLSLLKLNGKLIIVGVPPTPLQFIAPVLIQGRRSITGSFIGSIQETQEVIDIAAKREVRSMIEVIPMQDINKAMERLEKNDVRYRFVINVGDTIEKM